MPDPARRPPDEPIEDLIERSSLGSPEAKALRESIPREVAEALVRRSKETGPPPDELRERFVEAVELSLEVQSAVPLEPGTATYLAGFIAETAISLVASATAEQIAAHFRAIGQGEGVVARDGRWAEAVVRSGAWKQP